MAIRYYRLIIILLSSIVFISLVLIQKDKPAKEVMKQSDQLKQTIREKAAHLEEAPADAYIDKIWKKTPGRNGLRVNIEASYEKMKKDDKYQASLLVFDEVSPKKSLGDLPPAPIYRGHPEKQMVALLINVSWGEAYLPEMLAALKKHQVKGTFFLEGKWTKQNKQAATMIIEQGHEIGNHAYNHPDMQTLSRQAMQDQIVDTNNIIEALTNEKPKYFAPPSGSFNDEVVRVATREKMETILWTVDTIDWQNPSVSVMINRVMDKVHPGAMILMHPTSVMAEGLHDLVQELTLNQYQIGTVSDLLSEQR